MVTPKKPKEEWDQVGRPTKYEPRFCDMLVEHLGLGHTFESFAGLIDVDRANLYKWVNLHPEFRDAKQRGKEAGLLTLERKGLAAMDGLVKNWNPATWIFYMKNMHRDLYSDQKQVQLDVTQNLAALISKEREAIPVEPAEEAQRALHAPSPEENGEVITPGGPVIEAEVVEDNPPESEGEKPTD